MKRTEANSLAISANFVFSEVSFTEANFGDNPYPIGTLTNRFKRTPFVLIKSIV